MIKEKAAEIGELVEQKNQAYGDSFHRAHAILQELYPNGILPDDYKNLLAVIRVIDKLFRIAHNNDPMGENPWQDIAGYAILSCLKKEA